MAGLKNADDFARGESYKEGLLKWVLGLAGAGATLLFLIILLFSDKEMKGAMAYSWLFAITFFMTLAVGGIFWTLLHNATNSGWGTVVRRLMENLGSVVPFLFVLALPLLVPGFRNALWEWFPEQDALQIRAHNFAEKHLADKKQLLARQFEAASGSLEAFKADAHLEAASPGEKFRLESRLAGQEAAVAKLKAAAEQPDEEIKAALEEEYFMRPESALAETYHLDESEMKGHHDLLLHKKSGYLNKGFWYFRFVFFALALGGIAYFMRNWSLIQDESGDPKYFRRMRRAACGFLPLFAVSWTFLVFDWLMALDYTWFSTMWGVYLFAGSALSSIGFLVLLLTYLRSTGHFKDTVTPEHYHLMGKLMLAFTVFWAYIAFSQYFLIWYANITEETKFYLTRNSEFWNPYAIGLLVIGHFFLPFTVLLIQGLKKNPFVLCAVAVWNLAMHFFDVYWIIIPERGPSLTGGEHMVITGAVWLDLLAWIAVAGLFGFFLLRSLGQGSLFPCRDPRLDESLNLTN